jgi:hypothetical protein
LPRLEVEIIVLVSVDLVPTQVVRLVFIGPAQQLLDLVGQATFVIGPPDCRSIVVNILDSVNVLAVRSNYSFLSVTVVELSINTVYTFVANE